MAEARAAVAAVGLPVVVAGLALHQAQAVVFLEAVEALVVVEVPEAGNYTFLNTEASLFISASEL